MSDRRDDAAFQRETQLLTFLKQQEDAERVTLRYFDESGFSTTSSVPYGWQPVGSTYRIPCHRSPRLKVLGFLGRSNQLFFHTTEHTVTTATVIAAFDAFAKAYEATTFRRTRQLCFVVLDNASIHRSHAFQARREHWLL